MQADAPSSPVPGFPDEQLVLVPTVDRVHASVAAISVARIHTDHRSPDPSVDPLVTREDREWRFNALASVPINEAWSIVATVGRTDTKSNLPNFTRDNDFASLGASWRF